jgi:hypothetical protein
VQTTQSKDAEGSGSRSAASEWSSTGSPARSLRRLASRCMRSDGSMPTSAETLRRS